MSDNKPTPSYERLYQPIPEDRKEAFWEDFRQAAKCGDAQPCDQVELSEPPTKPRQK
jgi:hypothetical protein